MFALNQTLVGKVWYNITLCLDLSSNKMEGCPTLVLQFKVAILQNGFDLLKETHWKFKQLSHYIPPVYLFQQSTPPFPPRHSKYLRNKSITLHGFKSMTDKQRKKETWQRGNTDTIFEGLEFGTPSSSWSNLKFSEIATIKRLRTTQNEESMDSGLLWYWSQTKCNVPKNGVHFIWSTPLSYKLSSHST